MVAYDQYGTGRGAQVDFAARQFASQLDTTNDPQSVANALRQTIYTRPDLALDLAQRIQQYEHPQTGVELSINPVVREVVTPSGVQQIPTGESQINILTADGRKFEVASIRGDQLYQDSGARGLPYYGQDRNQFLYNEPGQFGSPFLYPHHRHFGSRNPLEGIISSIFRGVFGGGSPLDGSGFGFPGNILGGNFFGGNFFNGNRWGGNYWGNNAWNGDYYDGWNGSNWGPQYVYQNQVQWPGQYYVNSNQGWWQNQQTAVNPVMLLQLQRQMQRQNWQAQRAAREQQYWQQRQQTVTRGSVPGSWVFNQAQSPHRHHRDGRYT